ncbi:MAG: endonuclease [Bacteroidota bacterium]
MKPLITLASLLLFQIAFGQQPYYSDVDLTLTGEALYTELQQKISIASGSFTYGDIRDTVKITDENPSNTSDVLLVYGYNDSDGNCTTDRTRNKNNFGGSGCEYNREHVFARSNANPAMGSVDNSSTGIAADPHNVRPSDQQMNSNKGNKKFAAGSGNAGNVGTGNWYPGDEWKGDVARMMMYMYTRYGDRCLPSLNGVGSSQGSTDMLQIYLQWNAEDPVNDFEDQRNPYLETVYGNRNPFIDNPYLATLIWGGPVAEDRWGLLNNNDLSAFDLSVYPNPVEEFVYFTSKGQTAITAYTVYDLSGKVVLNEDILPSENRIDLSRLSSGMYLIEFNTEEAKRIEKIMLR